MGETEKATIAELEALTLPEQFETTMRRHGISVAAQSDRT
jgi:hypothetical protein